SHPGRVVWLVFNVAIALLLMELGVFKALEHILGLYSLVAVAWGGALVGGLVVNKPLGGGPAVIEVKRAHLYGVQPVGVGAMLLATIMGTVAYAGVFGAIMQALASFVALTVAYGAGRARRRPGARNRRQDHAGRDPDGCGHAEHRRLRDHAPSQAQQD